VFGADMIFRIPALLIALTIHEYAHARAAVSQGDPTPRFLGRLTLNPIPHLDPMGLIMLWIFKFGWAKPVPFNPANFRNWRRGVMITSLAGPLSNIAVAFLTAALEAVLTVLRVDPGLSVSTVIYYIYWYNIIFAIFNLLPFPPLDGSKVLTVFLPARYNHILDYLERYGPFLLLALVYLGFVGKITGPLTGLLDYIINIIIHAIF
jgi:Zn-dependent protease